MNELKLDLLKSAYDVPDNIADEILNKEFAEGVSMDDVIEYFNLQKLIEKAEEDPTKENINEAIEAQEKDIKGDEQNLVELNSLKDELEKWPLDEWKKDPYNYDEPEEDNFKNDGEKMSSEQVKEYEKDAGVSGK